jgi:hypothetical protein
VFGGLDGTVSITPPDAVAVPDISTPSDGPRATSRRLDYQGTWSGSTSQGLLINLFVGPGNHLQDIELAIPVDNCTKTVHVPASADVSSGAFEATADSTVKAVVRGTFDSYLSMHGSWDGLKIDFIRCDNNVDPPPRQFPAGTFTATRQGVCNPVSEDCAEPQFTCQQRCGDWAGYGCDVAKFLPTAPGEICYWPNDCGKGYTCAGPRTDGDKRCVRTCATDADCADGPCTHSVIECAQVKYDTGFGACLGPPPQDASSPQDIPDAGP